MNFSGPLEDRVALRELLDSFSDASIRHDVDAIANCWSHDGVWRFEMGEFRGRAEIRQTLFGLRDRFGGVHKADICSYAAFPAELRIEGDMAAGRSYVTMFAASSDSDVAAEIFGAYEDVYRREASRWLFAAREFTTLSRRQVPLRTPSGSPIFDI